MGTPATALRNYALAGVSVLAAFGVETALNPIPSLIVPLLISLLAVIVVVYFVGRGPGLAATAANLAVNCYFFAPPRFNLAVVAPADRWLLAAFAAAGITVSLLSGRLSGRRHFPRVTLLVASALLLSIVSTLVWFDFENARDAQAWVDHTYQVLNASGALFSAVQDAEARQRGYLLTGEQQYLDRYR